MYVHDELSGLGFSLKLPKWLRNLGATVVGQTHVSVPTPAGVPVVVDLGDPKAIERLKQALLGTRIQVGGASPSAFDQLVDQRVPGGWGTVLVGAGVVGGLLWFFGRRR